METYPKMVQYCSYFDHFGIWTKRSGFIIVQTVRTAQNIPEAILDVLQDALDRPIAFHRVFVKFTGSVTAALMLSQAVYWTKRANSGGVGWFYKTITQWEEETGLSRHEQETARKALRRFSFWQEERRGVPA